ncbi:hypothetical protein TNCV_494661 [Trichonephila clavipes]|nr:hypothetical protein TNCV_494661 [Trichonephila clavipes]
MMGEAKAGCFGDDTVLSGARCNSKSIENDKSNINSTSPNRELINKSDSTYSSSNPIRKNVRTGGGEKKKRKVSRKYHSYHLKFGFIEEWSVGFY